MNQGTNLFREVVRFLTPYLHNEDRRDAIIALTFYGSRLRFQLRSAQVPAAYTTFLVDDLMKVGEIAPGKHAVAQVMETVIEEYSLQGQQLQIAQDLIDRVQAAAQVDRNAPIPDLPPANVPATQDHIFISYSSLDRAFVHRLANDLVGEGLTVWVDNILDSPNKILAGEAWQQSLANALHRASHVVFCVSPNSARSPWAKAEIKRAGELDRKVVPILLQPISDDTRAALDTIPLGGKKLSDLQWIDFHTRPDVSSFNDLVQGLR